MKTIKFFMTLILVSSMVFAAEAGRVGLVITPPNDDGGARIACYIIEKQEVGTDRWIIVEEILAPMVEHNGSFVYMYTSCVVDDLIEGKTYIFRVTAENVYGKGDPGDPTDKIYIGKDDIEDISVVSGLGCQRRRSTSFSALSDAPFAKQALEREMVYRKEELLANLLNKSV